MIGYIHSVRDREYKECTFEIFNNLVSSAMVQTNIAEYRKGNASCKQMLPCFLFQGFDPNVLMGKKGSRLAKNLVSTGFYMMDFDHVENPYGLYDKYKQCGVDMGKLALAHITPSGKGLRLVFELRDGVSIEDAQKRCSEALGVECDAVVKDLSRLSFCPQKSDILFINASLLFQPVDLKKMKVVNYANDERNTTGTESLSVLGTSQDLPSGDAESVADTGKSVENTNGAAAVVTKFPTEFDFEGVSIPYKRIVEELVLLYGGTPNVGNRNNVLFKLVGDLARITDCSPTWLEQIVPDFGLPIEEVRILIKGQCKDSLGRGWTRKLTDALRRCRGERLLMSSDDSLSASEKSSKGLLPPQMPSELPNVITAILKNVMPFQMQPFSICIFPALAAHVNNALFALSDGTETELSLMSVLLGRQSVGKGGLKKPIKFIMRDIEKQDLVNRAREKSWREENQNRKSTEKGVAKPSDLVIRFLGSDTTPAAFMGRLYDAETGGYDNPVDFPNYCCYSHVEELEDLYSFCSTNRAQVTQMIRHSFDRDVISSERWTSTAANIRATLRWNWHASSTYTNGYKFFKNSLTDGTTSRIDFALLFSDEALPKFKYGIYDTDYAATVNFYIEKLTAFHSLRDVFGELVPVTCPAIAETEEYLDDYIRNHSLDDPNPETYLNYAWRSKVNAIKRAYILWICNDFVFDDTNREFVLWSFYYTMWCKMQLFADRASELFAEDQLSIKDRGHNTPLKFMKYQFTLKEFSDQCASMNVTQSPNSLLYCYKHRGLISKTSDGNFILDKKFCIRHGICFPDSESSRPPSIV